MKIEGLTLEFGKICDTTEIVEFGLPGKLTEIFLVSFWKALN